MRKAFLAPAILLAAGLLGSCTHGVKSSPPGDPKSFITIDSANKMIGSYLNSIDYGHNDSDLHSIIIDANSLREYLTSTEGGRVTKMKIMLAHTLPYINGGGGNLPCGYKSGALTVILAGYNDAGDYIYHHGGEVLDNAHGCPDDCPTAGPAASDFLTR